MTMNGKIAIGLALVGAALLGALAVAFGNAQSGRTGPFSAGEEEAIRDIVEAYILENPETVIDALNAYSQRERDNYQSRLEDAARANIAALLDGEHGHVSGANPDAARVAVIEFFDYHCGFCKRATGLVNELVSGDPEVKFVFREYPILRKESVQAAEAALAARAQGKYEVFHFAMMEASGVLDEARIAEIARSAGVDVDAMTAARDDPAIERALDATHRIASEMEIDGTPTFVIASVDGKFVDVVPGFDADRVRNAIAEAKKAANRR